MALTCTCRKKSRGNDTTLRRLFAEHELSLTGSDLQASFAALVASLLPSGLALPGTPTPYTGATTGYTLSPNTSNNPEPTFAPNFTGLVYNTPSGIWGAKASLFIQDNGENVATHFSDVRQGSLGDCWMMAAIAALAAYGKMPNGTTVIQQAFAAVSPAGSANPSTVTLNLYPPDNNNFGRTTTSFAQTVTTKIPVKSNNLTDVAFVESDVPGEYWPCMMEKAVAAALKTTRNGTTLVGYPALVAGYTPVGMSFFTPGISASFFNASPKPTALQLYTAWDGLMASGVTVCVSWIANPGAGVASGGEALGYYGLVSGHAYTVYSVIAAGGYKLALLRNPWGTGVCQYNQQTNSGEWTGAWSDCSPQWAANPLVKAACGFTGPRSDGLFWMSFDDIALYLYYYTIFIPSRADMRAVDLRRSPFNPCPPVSGYLPLTGMDYSGNDIRQVASTDVKTIAAACSSLPQCLGFNNYGYLKSAQPNLNPVPGICYYVKRGNSAAVSVTFTTSTALFPDKIGWSVSGTSINYPPGSFTSSFQTYSVNKLLYPGSYTVQAVGGFSGWNGGSLQVYAGSQLLLDTPNFWMGSSNTFTFTVPAS